MVFLSYLPTLVRGTSSTKVHRSGSHHRTTLSGQELPQLLRRDVGALLTHDRGQRTLLPALVGHPDHGGLRDAGWAMRWFSSSTDEIHSPPDLMTSLARSVSVR